MKKLTEAERAEALRAYRYFMAMGDTREGAIERVVESKGEAVRAYLEGLDDG